MRWSDLDSYGHVNNVKFYDYVQEARIALINDDGATGRPRTVWMVARQDVEYRAPLDFRLEPYEVGTLVDRHRHPLVHPGGRDPRPRRPAPSIATARTVAWSGSLAADRRPSATALAALSSARRH